MNGLGKIKPCGVTGATMRAPVCAPFALLPLHRFGYVAATLSSNCCTRTTCRILMRLLRPAATRERLPPPNARPTRRAAAPARVPTADAGSNGARARSPGPPMTPDTPAVSPPPPREALPQHVG